MNSQAENSNQAIMALFGFIADNSIISTACLLIIIAAGIARFRLQKLAKDLRTKPKLKALSSLVNQIANDSGMFIFAFFMGVAVFYMGIFFEVNFQMGVAFDTIAFLPTIGLGVHQVFGLFRYCKTEVN